MNSIKNTAGLIYICKCVIVEIITLFVVIEQSSAASQKLAEIDKEIADARTKSGEVITCSPYGRIPSTFTIEEASKRLRPGMILRLLPGLYNPLDLVIFEQDNIIVESDNSGGYVDMPLYLYGKDCIVRNINIRSVEADSGIIIDSKSLGITITSGTARGSAIIANCATKRIMLYNNGQDIMVKNTSVVTGVNVTEIKKVAQTRTYSTHVTGRIYNIINFGKMEKKGKVTFERCILFTRGNLFNGDHASMKLINLTLNDNLIWCEHSLFSVSEKITEIKTLEGLKSYFNFGNEYKNTFKKPLLKLDSGGGNDLRPGIFIITKGPGSDKEYGCNMSENKGIPIP